MTVLDDRRMLVVHIMKTGGTSLRWMLEDALGSAAVYPNRQDLAERPDGSYPGPRELLDHDRQGRTHGARVLAGHVPFVLAYELPSRPMVVAALREPVARTVSLLEHRRRVSPSKREASYRELLANENLVEQQIRDYQTRVFAFDSVDECPDHVHRPLEIDDARFRRACRRLEQTDVVGLTEDLPALARSLERAAGLGRLRHRRSNRGRYRRPHLAPDILARIEELTIWDRALYDRARSLAPRGRWGLSGRIHQLLGR